MERFAKVNELLAEYESLEAQMADPSIHADQNKARALGKRYAQLGPVIAGYRAYKLAEEDLIAGKELAESDPSFASEIVLIYVIGQSSILNVYRDFPLNLSISFDI